MSFLNLIPSITGVIGKLMDKFPSKSQLEQEEILREAQVVLVQLANEAAQMTAQSDTNKIEAAHRSVFVAGWRPMIGWTCALALCFEFLLRPLIMWLLVIFVPEPPILPALDMDLLLPLVFALLGIGGMRTFEKVKGVAK